MCYSLFMIPITKVNLDSAIAARLEAVGADRLPLSVRCAINADLLKACCKLIDEKITPDYVGDQTAQALKAAAAPSAVSTGEAQ